MKKRIYDVKKQISRLCSFRGTRCHAKNIGRVLCDRSRCRKPAADYALFVWGAAALCEKHLKEDTE